MSTVSVDSAVHNRRRAGADLAKPVEPMGRAIWARGRVAVARPVPKAWAMPRELSPGAVDKPVDRGVARAGNPSCCKPRPVLPRL